MKLAKSSASLQTGKWMHLLDAELAESLNLYSNALHLLPASRVHLQQQHLLAGRINRRISGVLLLKTAFKPHLVQRLSSLNVNSNCGIESSHIMAKS